MNYASAHVEATIHRNFDLSRYPMDEQALKIQIEDRSGTVVYKADAEGSDVNGKINLPGWILSKQGVYSSMTKYNTNYGDPSLAKGESASVPRLTMAVDATRSSNAFFLKSFSMLFLAAYCAFAAFLIRSDHIDARLAFSLSAVFIASATQGLLSSNLPDGEGLTLGDLFYEVTMVFIVVSVAGSIRTFRDFLGGHEDLSIKHSNRYALVLSALYPLVLLAIFKYF